MGLRCPKCFNEFSVLDQPCRKCDGKRIIPNAKGKDAPCSRCNGLGTEQSAMNRGNRSRGASNEAKAIKAFSKWWLKPDGTEYEWRRTPQSGGSALKEGWDMAGDLCTTAPDWPWSVECKRDKNWELSQLLTGTGRIHDFMKQATDDCPDHRNPMLFLMHPGPSQPTFVVLIKKNGYTPHILAGPECVRDQIWHGIYDHPEAPLPYWVMSLDRFLKTNADSWRISVVNV
jgi:hypothetical protein